MFDNLAKVTLLLIQILHFVVLGLSVLYLVRYYAGHKLQKFLFRHSMAWGLISEPFSVVLFLIMLFYGTFDETITYAISILIGLLPFIAILLRKA